MTTMSQKEHEKMVVNIVTSNFSCFDGFVDISDSIQERPDIVYRRNDDVLGIEHITLPVFVSNNRDVMLKLKDDCQELQNKYRNADIIDFNSVRNDIANLIQGYVNSLSSCCHSTFFTKCY